MRVEDFDFELPEDCIALFPARPRDASRLLHVTDGRLDDLTVRDLPLLMRAGDLLVLNDTRVLPAQLHGERAARGDGAAVSVDVTLLKRLSDIGGARWQVFARPAKRLKIGDVIQFADSFSAQVETRNEAEAILHFNSGAAEFDQKLGAYGAPPLPPYIARKRALTALDVLDYQTIYAEEAGSVAAPTAGLHFTPELLERLIAAGVETETITLHVGAGTFLPVTAEDVCDHKMHAEWGEITEAQADRINAARAGGGRIVAVGTTSLRLLESAARKDGHILPFREETSIFITPGYQFKAVDVLMTNFHLPRSTLFMLVCAFAGTGAMKGAYAHAIDAGYRFYSYGDACFLERAVS
ncbi:MAG: tRNA preQ1(34) S-adenosylmethionine ribosyltransferase-isomerase QueA [Parvularculaceae bacterium]|nr:tRNA preQ1(34) S-adenosylmethionine ribosyltransferase-isomerase QueA [Parvularculaceae bacterium]